MRALFGVNLSLLVLWCKMWEKLFTTIAHILQARRFNGWLIQLHIHTQQELAQLNFSGLECKLQTCSRFTSKRFDSACWAIYDSNIIFFHNNFQPLALPQEPLYPKKPTKKNLWKIMMSFRTKKKNEFYPSRDNFSLIWLLSVYYFILNLTFYLQELVGSIAVGEFFSLAFGTI